MFVKIICFLSLIALISCSSQPKNKLTKSGIYFSAGTQNLMDKDYTSALTNLLKANELEPNNPDILTNLAMAYYFKGQNDLAISFLKKSLEINPKNSDAKVNLASIYYYSNQISKAEKIYRDVLKDLTYDKQARTLYNLGLLEFEKKKNYTKAEDYFKQSVKEDENYCPSYFQLGMVYFKRNQFNTALKNFKEASMGTCFEAPAPHYYYGLTLLKLKKFDDARLKFDEVDSRFKKSSYATKARLKLSELSSIEIKSSSSENRISKKEYLESNL